MSLHTNLFRKNLPQYNPSFTLLLPQPTNDSLVVNRWADYLVGHLFKPEYEYKKAGIMLGEITPVGQYQADWLEPPLGNEHQTHGRAGWVEQEVRARDG